jgi:hypothetical protein
MSLLFSKSTEWVCNVQNVCHTQISKYGAHYCPRSAFPYHNLIMHIEVPCYAWPRDVLGSSVWVYHMKSTLMYRSNSSTKKHSINKVYQPNVQGFNLMKKTT